MTNKELIDRIELTKHDIKMRVRSVVYDPIEAMSEKNAATNSYSKEQVNAHKETRRLANEVMTFFSEEWRDKGTSEGDQFSQLKNHIRLVKDHIIPSIKKISSFYEECLNHRNYFSNSEAGETARKKMSRAVTKVEKVCVDLQRIDDISPVNENIALVNLLNLLQEVFDDIPANVIYINEVAFSLVELYTDNEQLQNHVLLNLKENICKHAFGTKAFKNVHLWNKKVRISYSTTARYHVVKVSNNGTPFFGKAEMVFDYGYCHGEQKHSGYGMNSAKLHMQNLGGDIIFKSTPNEEYKVTFELKLPKNE